MDCFDNNGGCSHSCEDSQCKCPTCWSLNSDGLKCEPTVRVRLWTKLTRYHFSNPAQDGKVRTRCKATSMIIEIDECVVDGYLLEVSEFRIDSLHRIFRNRHLFPVVMLQKPTKDLGWLKADSMIAEWLKALALNFSPTIIYLVSHLSYKTTWYSSKDR